MKLTLVSVIAAVALSASARADDVTVKITNVHLCCGKCVSGVEKAVSKVEGVKATADKDTGTVVMTAPDKATLKKGVSAFETAGYFGVSDNPDIKIKDKSKAKGEKVQSLQVKNVHLCCDKCVKAVNEALGTVTGVKANTAAKGAKQFEVTGDFTDTDVFTALEKAGLTGKVATN
jgi:copper chaperone CopZ